MKILIANDDGIDSEGIYHLAKKLKEIGNVYVVAPDKEQSASGHSITMHQPLRLKKVNFFDTDIDAWWVSGTPADCIKLGIETIIKQKPDLVVSGINKGANLGTDILYSGTVSAAIEGAILGIPAVAFSYASHKSFDFALAADIAQRICIEIIKTPMPSKTIFNVNIPCCTSSNIKGIKICRLGTREYSNNYEERKDPRGNIYYWLAGELIDTTHNEPDTDIFAISKNYVSITPIHIDLTNYELMSKLSNLDFKL